MKNNLLINMETHTQIPGTIGKTWRGTERNFLSRLMITISFIVCCCSQQSFGQAFSGTYPFTNVTTTSGLTDPTPVPTAPGVTFGSFTMVTPTTVSNPNASGRFSFIGWPTGATTGNDVTFAGSILTTEYYQVTVTVAAGFTADLTSITFDMTRSGSGVRHFSVRSNADAYANNLPASSAATQLTVVTYGGQSNVLFWNADASAAGPYNSTITLSGASFTGLTGGSSRTFRFYAWNSEGSGGTFSIDNVVISGTAISATTPTITVSSPSQIAAGNIFTGAVDQAISNFQAAVTVANATLNSVSFVTGNGGGPAYNASDIVNFKLLYNPTSNTFGSATQLGTTQASVASGSTVTFGSLNTTITNGSTGFFWITASVSGSATAGNKFNAQPPTLSFISGSPTGSISAGGAQTITVATPTISLANGTIANGNITQNTVNNVLYRTDVTVSTTSAVLNSASFTTAGSYSASDLTNLKLWYSTSATFASGTSTLLGTLVSSMGIGAGSHAFSGLSQTFPIGTGYLYVTADVPCAAVSGNTINVNAIALGDFTFASGSPSGSGFTAGGTQTIIEATPINVTQSTATATATGLSGQVSLQWTYPSGCYNEVLIVAATAANTGTPTGNGSAYTPGASNSPGTALGNGFVVFKGNALAPQVITGLTNETQYFFKIFTRNGTTWSSGTEITGTPVSTLYLNTFTGTSACPTNGNVPVMAANSAGTALSRSTITCSAAANVFNSTTLNITAAVVTTSYIEFSATAAFGYRLDLTSLSFFRQVSSSAPNQLDVAYSTDGTNFTFWGAAPNSPTTGTVAKWDFADFSGPYSGTVIFRFYPYGTLNSAGGAASASGTFRLDDVTLNGVVTPVAGGPVALSAAHPAAANIGQGTSNNIIGGIQLDVAASPAALTGVTVTTAGTYVSGDISANGFAVWLSASPLTVSGATQLGTNQAVVASGGNISVSGLGIIIPANTTRYILVTANITPTAVGGHTLRLASTAYANIVLPNSTTTGADPVPAGLTPGNDQTILATNPAIAISNTTVAPGNVRQGDVNKELYNVRLDVTVNGTILNSAAFTTAGTYQASDLSDLTLWYSTSFPFVAGTSTPIATLTSSLGAGLHTFSPLTQALAIGTHYLYVTASVPCAGVIGRNINVQAISTGDFTFSSGNASGSGYTAGGSQSIINGDPNNVTAASATGTGNTGEATITWTNPPPCFSEVLIVAATASNTGTPTGDGTAYTPGASNSPGTALGNGFVVYKGTSSPQTLTGLTTGVTNYLKIFTRFGNNWSTGVEVTVTPFVTVPSGNVVVLQLGNGTETLSANGNSMHLKQFTTSGTPTLVNTVDLPTSGCTPFIDAGNSTAVGFITRSDDRDFIIVPGYVTPIGGATALGGSSSTVINRGIGRVDAAGNFSLVAKSSTALSGANIRSAVSDGANNFWALGSSSGLTYFGNNGAQAIVSNAPIQNMRTMKINNGNLYFSSASNGTPASGQPFGVFKVGAAGGLPTTSGVVAVNIVNTGNATPVSPYGFEFNPAGTVCYIADDRATSAGGGIQKWVFNGSAWVLAYRLPAGGAGVGARGLTINFNGTFPVIFGTSAEATLNRLFEITDKGDSLSSAATFADISTAGTNMIYRGVAFAPVADCQSAIVITPTVTNSCGTNNGQINISVSGGTAPYSYAWSNVSGTVCATTQNLSGIDGGAYTVKVSDALGHCFSTSTSTVIHYDLPTPVITGTPAFCPGYSTILNAGTSDAGGAYTSYSWSPSSATTQTLSVNTASQVSVTVTNVNGCIGTSTVLTVTQYTPPAPVIAGSNTICSGGQITLDAGAGYSLYHWSPGDEGTQTIDVTLAGTYSVVVTDNHGCTGTASKTVTEGSITVAISGNLSYCAGGSTTLSVPTGYATYDWSNGVSGTNTITVTAGTYSVTVSDFQCTGTSSPVTVVQNPLPTVNISPASPGVVCYGTPVGLTASGNSTSYSWSPSTGLNTNTGASVSATPTSTTIYTVTGTDGNGCSKSSTVTVSINPLPPVAVTPVSVVCAGSSATLTATGATSYSWNPSTYLSATTGATVTSVTPAANISYTVTGTDGNNCSNTAVAQVVVTPLLNAPAVNSPVPYCQNAQAIAHTATPNPSNASLVWYTVPSGGSGSTTAPTPSTSTVGSTSYYVAQTMSGGIQIAINGFADNRTPDLFSVLALADIPANTNIYFTDNGWQGNTFRNYNSSTAKAGTEDVTLLHTVSTISAGTVIVSYTGSPSYTWTTSGAIGGSAGSSNDFGTLNISSAGDQVYAFTSNSTTDPMNPLNIAKFLFVFDASGAFEPATSTTSGSVPPGLSTNDGTAVTLLGDTTVVTGSAGSGTFFSLINDGQYRSSSQWYQYIKNSSNYSILALNTTATFSTTPYHVAASCESARSEIIVNVSAAPIPDATSNSPVCEGGTITLFSDPNFLYGDYAWTGPGTFTNSSNDQNPTVVGATGANSGNYTVTLTDPNNGCSASQTIAVVVQPCGVTLNVKMYIQGFYSGNGLMEGTAGQGCLNIVDPANYPDPTDAELVTIAAMDAVSYSLVESHQGILKTNGTISLSFSGPAVSGQSYYLKLITRNLVETWSRNPVPFTSITSYDFTTASTQAYDDGFNLPMKLIDTSPDRWACYNGDITADGAVDSQDMTAEENDANAGAFGYNASDLNGDGGSDSLDMTLIENNGNAGIFTAHP